MTEIERKALALVNEVQAERNHTGSPWNSPTILSEALDRAIERHEAYKQEVSDAVEQAVEFLGRQSEKHPRGRLAIALARFILPKPVDPLVEALWEAFPISFAEVPMCPGDSDKFRAALAARGLKIVEDKP